MKVPEGWPSLPLSPSRDKTVNCETLSKVDWGSVLRFREQLSDKENSHSDASCEGEPEPPPQGASQDCLAGSNLLRCCPGKAGSIASPCRGNKPGKAGSPGKFRSHALPFYHPGNVPSAGGSIKLNTCPIINHPALSKAAIKSLCLPSLIPSDVVGKKKPPRYDNDEPTSPEVTCLGQVREKQKQQYKQIKRSSDKKQNKSKKKKAPCGPLEKRKQLTSKQSWAARRSMERKRGLGQKESGIDLGRFSSDSGAVSANGRCSRGERGALLTAALIHVLAEIKSRGAAETNTEYVPQVPPRNSLLLIRASRNLESSRETPGIEVSDNTPVHSAQQNAKHQLKVTLPKTSPEVCIWKRRSIAQPSALNVSRPVKV